MWVTKGEHPPVADIASHEQGCPGPVFRLLARAAGQV